MIKRYIQHPFLQLVLALVILLLLQFNPSVFNNERVNSFQFNEDLNAKEILAKKELKRIQNTQKIDSLFTSDTYNHLFSEQGISFFIIENGLPSFWTNRNSWIADKEFNKKNGFIKLKNGWYQYLTKKKDAKTFLALILIQHEYEIKNNYLTTKFHHSFKLPQHVSISTKKQEQGNIKNTEGEFLFSLIEGEESNTTTTNWLIIALFFTGIFLLISSFSKFSLKIIKNKPVAYAVIIGFLIALRLILSFLSIPSIVFQQELFSPNIYAQSAILSSLGELLITSLFFLISIYYFSKLFRFIKRPSKLLIGTIIISSTILPVVLADWIEGLVKNSKINLDVTSLLELNMYSFVGIFSIIFLFVSIILLARIVLSGLTSKTLSKYPTTIFYLITSCISITIGYFFFDTNTLLSGWFLVVIIIFSIPHVLKTPFYKSALLILIIALTISYGFIHFGTKKEVINREYLAKKVAEEKDPVAEYLFDALQLKIKTDTLLKNKISNYWEEKDLIDKHITSKYFGGFWNKYNISFTSCRKQDSILIEPDNVSVNCLNFFNNRVEEESINPFERNNNLNFLYSEDGVSSYLAKIEIEDNASIKLGPSYLFIELSPKLFSKTEGYPKLLLNKNEINQTIDIGKYSYAKYKKGKLVNNSGPFSYRLELNKYFHNTSLTHTIYEGYDHIIYKNDKNTTIILSTPKKTIFNHITTFSYLFIVSGLLCLLIGFIFKIEPFNWQIAITHFSTKIQVFVIASIFLSFIMFGWGTSYYLEKQYVEKNNHNISEKVQSVLIELEHKLGNETTLTPALYDYMTFYLIKFSNVFYTDINLYSKQGELLSSSRPEIFERGLISTRMNPEAFKQLHFNKKSAFNHNESIGELEYLSAYVPFRNEKNEILAYLNLPYFAKQNELENELSSFFTALINIYVLLFLISAIIAVFFANYISEPVRMIKDKLSALQLGKSYELIDWKSNDEIGALVTEYNKKVLELENSANLLAKSERESAWREMAKQVAHEIKNPLTPMKLSIQHLERSAKDNTDGLTERIKRTAKTLIEQIDTLTTIANEFSNFAEMPKANEKIIEIIPIIETTIDLFKKESIQINLQNNCKNDVVRVIADKDQLSRVFNNLIKNAIQAIPTKKEGEIEVIISDTDSSILIEIKDNGTGIPTEQQEKIFVPNFTTKTTGMGLGLAMVKNIIENTNGRIWFETTENIGTTFYIELPKP